MARTKLYDPFNIGIENLLTSSNDDPNFDFDLFMEQLQQDCPELARDLTPDGDEQTEEQMEEPQESELEGAVPPQQPQPQLDTCTELQTSEPQPGM